MFEKVRVILGQFTKIVCIVSVLKHLLKQYYIFVVFSKCEWMYEINLSVRLTKGSQLRQFGVNFSRRVDFLAHKNESQLIA